VTRKERCRAAVRRCECRVRRPGLRRARLPLVRHRAAPGVGVRARAGHPAERRAPAAAAPAGTVPLVRRHPRPAGVVGRAQARGLRRGDRAGGHRVGAARTGTARLGAELGVPAATVRGWLRRLRARAGQMLQEATAEFGRLVAVIETPEGRDPPRRGRQGRRWATRWPSSSRARSPRSPGTAGRKLTWTRWSAGSASPPPSRPRPEADPAAPSRASPCPRPARDAHHEHPASSTPHSSDTASIPATPRASPHSRAPGMPVSRCSS
jgi:hypothetical protein